MLRMVVLLALISGPGAAHEVSDWQIKNVRGDTLRTEITTESFAGDWCGEEPATLALICDDTKLSLVFHSNCTPSATNNGKTFVSFYFDKSYLDAEEKILDVSEDQKTLIISGILFDIRFGLSASDTLRVSLTEWGRRGGRDVSFDISKFDEAVRTSGMQCNVQRSPH